MITLSAFTILLQIILLDLSMAADNAMAVGLAAAGLPHEKRRIAIAAGIAGAAVLRILLAIFAVQILHFTGLLIAGGLLLLWVGWKMHTELRHGQAVTSEQGEQKTVAAKSLAASIRQIIIADISMSLDNVLGVAGIARDDPWILVAGLSLSVVLMGTASGLVAKLIARRRWIGYAGLVVILYTALHMIIDGLKPYLS